MALPGISNISYLRKVFFFTHGFGLLAGVLFPVVTAPMLGSDVRFVPYFFVCMVMGYMTGACMYVFVHITLKKQLRLQLKLLQPLTGATSRDDETVEKLHETLGSSVNQVEMLVQTIIDTIEELSPRHSALSERSSFLAERAIEGLNAAKQNHLIISEMEEQQRNIGEQMEILNNRTQEEAALSRQLSSSLQEMAEAMEHSNMKFLETTSTVDEMASSSRQVADQSSDFSKLVAGTVSDLRNIEQSLESIRSGATASVSAADTVKTDAENGLAIMNESISEMDRIDEESNRATAAMQRLVQQTEEVTKIIEVIKDLVSDTELLAFNAAIIAAKAGAEGKGFSVVAGEIRDLADRTTTSAEDIHSIISAIASDTSEVTGAVEATASRIARGKQLSLETGEALRKIMDSAKQSSATAQSIADETGEQGARSHALIENVSQSLQSVQAISNAMQEQLSAVQRIQDGTNEMKMASDQMTRGMEEQVRANKEFDRGLSDRESQIQVVNEAIRFQGERVQQIYALLESSQKRLRNNNDKINENTEDIEVMEILSGRLRELADVFRAFKDELH